MSSPHLLHMVQRRVAAARTFLAPALVCAEIGAKAIWRRVAVRGTARRWAAARVNTRSGEGRRVNVQWKCP